jgi:hypothetical protein
MNDPDLPERDDPEASYRRGYQQGAKAAMDGVSRFTADKLRDWVEVKLAK